MCFADWLWLCSAGLHSGVWAEGRAPMKGAPSSVQRERETADRWPWLLWLCLRNTRIALLTGRWLVITWPSVSGRGVGSAPPQVDTGRRGRAGEVEWKRGAYFKQLLQSAIKPLTSLYKKLENIVILPKNNICSANNTFIPCCSVFMPFYLITVPLSEKLYIIFGDILRVRQSQSCSYQRTHEALKHLDCI